MDSPPISPISHHSRSLFASPDSRRLQRAAPVQSRSSSMESLSWRPSTYSRTSSDDSLYLPIENHRSGRRRPFSGRNPSQDSLQVPVNNRQNIKRWNGITREAVNWNSLPRDPELFFPTGNCLIYLYPAGHSQRGPSFRIPYHVLLYSGCQPLVQQCLVSTLNISSPDHIISKPLSYGAVDYTVAQDTRTYLYLYPPAQLSRDESYSYHITTRNFFAWLIGIPLVGVDPVSALLDLKARMDIWRDPHANNFEAIFEYARQQAYGDFEEIKVEIDKRMESERINTHPLDQTPARDRQYRHQGNMVRRSDSLKQRLRNSVTRPHRSHIASQDRRMEQVPQPAEKRQSLPRLITFPVMPPVPSADEVDGALQRMSVPARLPRPGAASHMQAKEMGKDHRRTPSSASNSPVSPINPADNTSIDAALRRLTGSPSTESVVTISNSQASKLTKKKHRVSWADNNPTVAEARLSQTDLTYPNMQGLGLQSAQASSSAMNVSQPTPPFRRSLTSMPLSSHPVAGPSKRQSMPVPPTGLLWREDEHSARPMGTAALVSIPMLPQTNAHKDLERCSDYGNVGRPETEGLDHHNHQYPGVVSASEPCSCCGKMRRPGSIAPRREHRQPPRPASVRSMKSFRSTKSWRSLRSVRSSLSLRTLRSSLSLTSIRAYLTRQRPQKSFAEVQRNMKDRRASFKARLHKEKKPDLVIDHGDYAKFDNARPPRSTLGDSGGTSNSKWYPRYRRNSLNDRISAPVELEAEPVVMKTVPELTSSDTGPWSAESYSSSPHTPVDDLSNGPTGTMTTTIRPKEIYTSREYRHQPAPRHPQAVSNLLRQSDEDADFGVLDIGTPGGFEVDFVDTLISQLEAAEIGGRIHSEVSDDDDYYGASGGNDKGKGRADQSEVDGGQGIWMGMTSSFGMPRLHAKALA